MSLSEEEKDKLNAIYTTVSRIERDLYTKRLSDGKTPLQRFDEVSNWFEFGAKAGRLFYWILGAIAGFILSLVALKDTLLEWLGKGS